jgi:hypothetical protein
MKRILLVLAVAALALSPTALAKGPSKASLDGPGIGKAIAFSGSEEPGNPLGDLTQMAGFFPAVFSQEPNPMLPSRPKGDLGPRYTIDYTVPGPEGEIYMIKQDVYPYANGSAATYMKPGQEIFHTSGTVGGWFQSPDLKAFLVKSGLPKTAPAADSSSAGFLSSGRLGAGIGGALLLAASAWLVMRRRPGRPAA